MNKPQGYEEAQAFTGESHYIVPGGYICQIRQAVVENPGTDKESLALIFDVAEGEYKGYYAEQFNKKFSTNPDAKWQGTYRQFVNGKGTPFFKGLITAIENSNTGYKWDWNENTLRGKMFGAVMGQEEYLNGNGDMKLSTKCRFIRSVEQIRKGVEVPAIKKLQQQTDMASLGKDVFPSDDDFPF